MASALFRKEALDRLASPERLDTPVRLVGLPQWALLATLIALIAAAIGWAALTEAPARVSGRGILIDRAGLAEIVSSESGRVATINVSPGQYLAAGEPIATLARSELDREIAGTRARLAQAQTRLARLRSYYAGQSVSEGSADRDRLASLGRTRAELNQRRRALEERARRIATLVPRGFVGRDTLIAAEAAAAETRERIATLDNEAARLQVDTAGREGRYRLALLDEQTAIDQLQRELAQLEARASDQTVVRAQFSGQVVEVKVGPGDVLAPGSALVTIAQGGRGGETVALLYVPAGDGRRIEPGMAAEIVPDSVRREVHGAIRGRVLWVSPLPASREGMRRVLRNDQVVDALLAGGAVSEVQVRLERDPSTPTGLRWTSSRGPSGGVGVGTLSAGRVVTERRPVLAWLLPWST